MQPTVPALALDDLLALSPSADRKHPHKDVLRLTDESSGAGEAVFVKRQWAWERRVPRWSDWRDGVARVPDPVREWRGLMALADAGLDVAVPQRLLTDRDRHSPRAAVVTSAVPAPHSLAELARRGDLLRLDPFARRSLAVALIAMADQVHRSGLRWRSMKAKHVYPQRVDNDWRLWLIDCEGVRCHATGRQQRRDRRLLRRSLQNSGADAAFLAMMDAGERGTSVPRLGW